MFKVCAILLLSLFGVSAVQATELQPLKAFDKIVIHGMWGERNETLHAGVIFKFKLGLKYGVYGLTKNDEQFSNEEYTETLLGEITMNTTSTGIKINLLQERDETLSLNYLRGKPLRSICGDYNGAQVGLTIIGGAEGFTAWNSSGVMIRSITENYGFNIDLSEINLGIRCVDRANPNWYRSVVFSD